VSAAGTAFAITNQDGVVNLRNNWLKTGWVASHGGLGAGAAVNDVSGNVTGAAPGFLDEANQDFRVTSSSACVDKGTTLAAGALPVDREYVKHRSSQARASVGALDIGAFEFGTPTSGGGGSGSGTPTISVSPLSFAFGVIEVGSASDTTFVVTNTGTGTLSGAASVQAPFAIVSGGTYSLAAGQSANVVVRFTPSAAGASSRSVTFTGAGGASATLTGTAQLPATGGGGGGTNTTGGGGGGHGGGCALASRSTSSSALAPLVVVLGTLVARRRHLTRTSTRAAAP
jgi:hypothetical protein